MIIYKEREGAGRTRGYICNRLPILLCIIVIIIPIMYNYLWNKKLAKEPAGQEVSSIDMYNNDVGQESAQKIMKQTGDLKAATLYFAS